MLILTIVQDGALEALLQQSLMAPLSNPEDMELEALLGLDDGPLLPGALGDCEAPIAPRASCSPQSCVPVCVICIAMRMRASARMCVWMHKDMCTPSCILHDGDRAVALLAMQSFRCQSCYRVWQAGLAKKAAVVPDCKLVPSFPGASH